MKIHSSRKGMELSINFIVMLILALAVFMGGLVFAMKFFGQAETVRASLDTETERQLERLLDSGSPVVLPISNKEIFRKKHDTFGLGIFARYNGDYTISYIAKDGYDKQKKSIPNNLDIQVSPTTIPLTKNQKGKILILVQVPTDAQSVTYIFELQVKFQGDTTADTPVPPHDYDNPVQLIIRVP